METSPTTENRVGASDAPTVTIEGTVDGLPPTVAKGQIVDYLGFKAQINTHIRRICAKSRKWASDEAVELFMCIVDDYYAQLADPTQFDTGDLKEFFQRFANMNAVYNRLAKAGLIDTQEKKPRSVADDLL